MRIGISMFAVLCILWIVTYQVCFAQNLLPTQYRPRIKPQETEVVRNDFTFEGIPEKLLLQMKHIRSISQFFKKFIFPSYNLAEEQFKKIFSNDSSLGFNSNATPELVNARRAFAAAAGLEVEQFAGCRPELQVVKLEKPASPGVMLWPPCVRARRCGGCCTSKLLECRPVEIITSNITVLQVRYNPYRPEAFESEGLKDISLEQHERCVCGCKQKADQCISGLQEYRPAECRCVCLNIDQALQCSGRERMWDSGDCSCKCRYPTECSTGFFFNFRTCRCEVFVPLLAAAAAFRPGSLNYTNKNLPSVTEITPMV